jgi:thiol-disulfide isomerase/thioredoxin
MKRILILSLAICLVGCKKEEPKDYATVSGKIENPHESKTLKIFKGRDYEKVIALNDDGTFSDTLKVTEGDYSMQHGEQYGLIYLKNDNESILNTNYEDFAETMVFSGDGADINNFMLQSYLSSNDYFTEELIANGGKEELEKAINDYKSAYDDLKTKFSTVDSTHVALMDRNVEGTSMQLRQFMTSKIAMRETFPKGSPSPTFGNYENYAGGSMSLSDLRGKYVYFDIWATWCGPCIKEIPSLKKVEKQYEGKNIQFVSISVDEGRGYRGDKASAYAGWKKMIAEKELGGIQLIADNGFQSQFIKDYQINGIPRFILVDPEGNIVSADAPRPSSSELIKMFDKLEL